MQLLRFLRTVQHLRPVQIYGRVWHRLHRPRVNHAPAPAARTVSAAWTVGCERPASLLDAQTFRFLNLTGMLSGSAAWNDPSRPRLWRYNAHYFDDLNAAGASERGAWHRALIARWVAENPPTAGAGWEPYPTSLRITNWIKWAIARGGRGDDALDAGARDSLAVQARWLAGRLEFHLLGNHLWTNAKSLVFAGAFFDGSEAERWLRTGSALIARELQEQVLPDGGHFERSPMYQGIVLEDVLDLLNLGRVVPGTLDAPLEKSLRSAAVRMHHWLRVMTHPDGQISLLNDAAFGIAPSVVALTDYARRLDLPVNENALAGVELLADSGYARLQNARAVVICDVAPVGPDYLPGHAHADTLSFELSVDGRRVVVDSGTSTYDEGTERMRQRGTAAHNTVVVDDLDSSEVWGGFRVARRARPLAVRCGSEGGAAWLEGAHDGYRRLAGRVTHHRRWELQGETLTVTDHLDGRRRSAVASLHLHPDCSTNTAPQEGGPLEFVMPGGPRVSIEATPARSHAAHPSTWHPEFGRSIPNTIVRTAFDGPTLATRVRWT